MALTEDFAAFFNTGEFADAVTVNGVSVRAIFDGPYASLGQGEGMSSALPQLTMPSVDVPASVEGKPVVISTGAGIGNYRVAQAEPDGTGVTVLMLERTS